MKIVDRKTFLEMPAGTVYAKYEPCIFGELNIKGDTCRSSTGEPIDWFCQSVSDPWFEGVNDSMAHFDTLDSILRGEAAPPLDYDMMGRDGLFDQEQLFAVWEKRDVRALQMFLSQALIHGYPLTDDERALIKDKKRVGQHRLVQPGASQA